MGSYQEIVSWLLRAQKYAENEEQKHRIDLLVKYYRTGDLRISTVTALPGCSSTRE